MENVGSVENVGSGLTIDIWMFKKGKCPRQTDNTSLAAGPFGNRKALIMVKLKRSVAFEED